MQLPPGSRRARVELIPMGPLPFPITAVSPAAVLPVLYPGLSFMSMIILACCVELVACRLQLVACGFKLDACALELDACRLLLESLGEKKP